MSTELQIRDQDDGQITIRQAFDAAATKQLDEKSLAVMEKLLAMDAERRFTLAFAALQKELPTITATTVIQNRGKYEKFEDIMKVVGPILTRHGFTMSFSNDYKDGRVIETCHLSFGGHTRSNAFGVRVGRGDDDTQKDLKAATTAKRLALCNALNIVIKQDMQTTENDVSIEGDPNAKITQKQADDLEHRCKMLNWDSKRFLAYTKAESFTDIPNRFYAELNAMLRRKEGEGK